MKHNCHAVGCRLRVHPKLLMCRNHWFMVPKMIRDRVWATYVPGQEQSKTPTNEYMAAFYAAVGAVAKREGNIEAAAECERKQREYEARPPKE